jgi:hypothetical protein
MGKPRPREMKRGGVRRAAQRHVAAKPGGPVEKVFEERTHGTGTLLLQGELGIFV